MFEPASSLVLVVLNAELTVPIFDVFHPSLSSQTKTAASVVDGRGPGCIDRAAFHTAAAEAHRRARGRRRIRPLGLLGRGKNAPTVACIYFSVGHVPAVDHVSDRHSSSGIKTAGV